MVAAEAADLALHTALLMRPFDPRRRERSTRTGSASAARRTGRSRPAGGPSAPSSPPTPGCRIGPRRTRHRTTRTPATCPSRNACWVSTSDAMQNAAPEKRRAHQEQMHLRPRARRASTSRLAPVDLRRPTPGRVDLRHEHLPDRQPQLAPALAHVLADRHLRDISAVLIDQPPPDPLRGVPLLARRHPIGDQPLIDQRPILRPASAPAGSPAPLRRRDRRRQRLPHRPRDAPHAAPPTPASTAPPDHGPV